MNRTADEGHTTKARPEQSRRARPERSRRARPEQSRRANPFTTGLVIGLGWGLVFGFADGLFILLELPTLQHLRVRLQALLYLMAWHGLMGALLIGLLGLIVWGMALFLRRDIGRRSLVAIYSGTSIGLASLIIRALRMPIPLGRFTDLDHAIITLVVAGVTGMVGLIAGLSVYGIAIWWQDGRPTGPVRPVQGLLRPLRWRTLRAGVLGFFLTSVTVLVALAVYRNYLVDLAVFQLRPSSQAATPERPNIVLITIDALRADHLGIYGYDPDISPNIDGLADRGIVFDQAIAQGPRTDPSVSSFMTSLYPSELGIVQGTDLRVDRMRVMLAEMLQDAGYRTQAYITNPLVCPENGFDQGLDDFVYARDRLAFDLISLHERTTLLQLVCQELQVPGAQAVCRFFDRGHELVFDQSLIGWKSDQWITEYSSHFLRQHKDERFFLWLFYVGPHIPYDPPELFRPMPSEITPRREQELRGLSWRNAKRLLRPVDVQGLMTLYDAEIVYTDKLVGQVLDELERLGLADRTLVILSADHGEEFADHGGYSHGALYDEIVRVPFIISGAGVKAGGRREDTQVRLLDLVPTVCGLLGVPVSEEAEGRSLVPLLRGEDMEDLPAFSEAVRRPSGGNENKSIRLNGYKLIHYVVRGDLELYDLRTDPHEQANLAEEEPAITEALLAELTSWMERNAQRAEELPRFRPTRKRPDAETERRLREAGY